jgi:hypothetical protein
MSKMGSHDPFGYLIHKLWSKDTKYRWKALDKGYNFTLNLTSIGGLHTKLWDSKVARIPISRISRPPLGNFETK